MYLNSLVPIPSDRAGITRKAIKGVTYVYYASYNFSTCSKKLMDTDIKK